MDKLELQDFIDKKRGEKARAYVLEIDLALVATGTDPKTDAVYALKLVQAFDAKMWSTIAVKAGKRAASDKTRAVILNVYKTRVADAATSSIQ